MAKNTMTLTDNRNGKSYEYNIIDGTRGPSVVDIRSFYKDSGMFTYDPGYTSTASCESKITFIDGENSELRYRGYEISELAGKKSYLDVCHLLMMGKLPTKEESKDFDLEIRHRSFLNEGIIRLFDALPDGAHPMATMGAATMALSAFYKDHLHLEDEEEFKTMRRRILAKMPTIAAMAYRNSIGTPLIYPDVNRYFTENFLYMLRAYPGGKMKYLGGGLNEEIKQVEVDALDAILTLHADHEQNASTTTVRNVGSTEAHPYVAIASGISALWGSAHGGANEKVMDQLRLIGDVKNVPSYIAKAKDKNDPFRLMGFGHRVYKNRDPRAETLKKLQDQLREELNLDSKLLDIAAAVEDAALSDSYFRDRGLYPNIDFYSGVILTALKIPVEMFTPIFVIGRIPGWISQWSELKQDPSHKIARPRQLYTGN
ncbi:citrate (Si)-synthase [Malaciobacter halophilus]|uniref:Citrate synthase n=1 Tax=Malaciobacter halophilus TaxID=197482 RepID=A0A2N1J312_9BACT|nr:citrate synthase [Malaciobacter halophilus]AXH10613.1 citrate synthase [Malaciobacter halophilus]PKI80943.1 citrate (Si)-synthase [Malaciobacter halophilus]